MSDWQTVPKEADDEMLRAGAKVISAELKSLLIKVYPSDLPPLWRAMLAAAPPPPAVRVTPQMVEAARAVLAGYRTDYGDTHIDAEALSDVIQDALNAVLAVSFPIQQDADE